MIEINGLTYRYGNHTALADLDLVVPTGSLYALLGPNGSGKTTLLQILTGLRTATIGKATVLGKDVRRLTAEDRTLITYVAEGQRLPDWMSVRGLEAYLAPLYPSWDCHLADELRERFGLDSARRVGTLSRGETMKAALLCALAPRPRLVIMDEPFSGIDVGVKDELVRGLLAAAGSDAWTVLICSHDLGEIELLADWVGFIDRGRLKLSESMDQLRDRFKRVEVFVADADTISDLPDDWLAVERAGQRTSFILSHDQPETVEHTIGKWLPASARIEVRSATLREIFVALSNHRSAAVQQEEPLP